jgi:hypothetical protein
VPTVVLLVLLTLWLPVALLLLGNWRGVTAAALFLVLGIVFWTKTDMTWRSYLMASLLAHVAIAVPHGRLDRYNRKLGPYWQAAVSVAGLVWLWIDAGAPHWPYVVGILLLGGAGAAAAYLLWDLRPAKVSAPLPEVHQPPPPSSGRSPAAGPGRSGSGRPAGVPPSTPPPESQRFLSPEPEPAPLRPPWQPAREPEPPLEPPPEPEPPLVFTPPGSPPADVPAPPRTSALATEPRPELPCHGWPPRGRVPRGGPAPSHGDGITFDLVPPSAAASDAAQPHMRLTPRLRPAAEVATVAGTDSPASAPVPVSGLARFFPAGTVHGQRSTAPVDEDRCELMTVDHFHLHRLSAPLAPLLEPGSPAQAALATLVENREDPSAATTLRHALPPLPDPVPPAPSTEVTTVVAADPPSDTAPNTLTSTTYVAEDTLLPVVDLLARSEGLVRSLVDALTEEEPGEHQARFLRTLLLAGRRDGELALLPRPNGPPDETDAATFGLFGCAVVDPDCAVLLRSAP